MAEPVQNNNYDKDKISGRPPMFDGENFDYWKDLIESFFLAHDGDLWDMVTDGYTHPVGENGQKIERRNMTDQQKKEFKNHHKARTILLSAISHTEHEKITNRESAKHIFDSLRMTHEGNTQVKETKALALIQKYEAFKMEEDETIETMFSRFQILVAGLKVLDKGYSTADHVKKIIRSLPKKWRPMVTALKLAKNLNEISLEELISSLRSHEIELEEDEPQQKKGKSLALKSNKKYETKAFQAEEESSSSSSSEEDELSLISRRVKQLWKHRQKKFRNTRSSNESSSGHKKTRNKEVVCFECKEPGHYKSDCPKLQKEKPKKKFTKEKKKSLMATWDDSESSEEESESEDEHANIALMANTSDDTSSSDSDSEAEEVFSIFSRSQLEDSLSEILEKYQQLQIKYKNLKHGLVSDSEETRKLRAENSELKETISKLKKENSVIKNDLQKAQKESDSEVSTSSDSIIKEYDYGFQKFLAKNIDRSKMASLIYGVSRNGRKGIGYVKPKGEESYQPKQVDDMIIKHTPLHSHFTYGHTHDIKYTSESYSTKSLEKPKLNQNFVNSNNQGPKKIWVPKDKIIYVADVFNSKIETPIMVPGLWMLSTHDGKKAYVPKSRT